MTATDPPERRRFGNWHRATAGVMALCLGISALAVLGAANILTAALCTITDGQPTSVCTSSGVRAGAAQLRAA